MLIYGISSFLASFGFAYIFNVKGMRLLYAGLGGSVGYLVYGWLNESGYSLLFSMFSASVALSLFSEIIARIVKAPVSLFLVAALIPLVPGGGMYRMMLAILQNDTTMFAAYGMDTLFSAGALALGTMFASTLVKMITQIKKRKKGQKLYGEH